MYNVTIMVNRRRLRINSASSKKAGFTMVELLVVISIIALFASIAMANLNKSRDKARVATGSSFDAQLYHLLGNDAIVSYDFNEGGTANAIDNSGNGRTGNNVGSIPRSSATRTGKGYSVLFADNDNQYFETALLAPIPFPNGLTMSAWIKLSTDPSKQAMASLWGDTAGDKNIMSFSINSDNRLKVEARDPVSNVQNLFFSLPLVEINDWAHIAFTFKNTGTPTCQMYINGRPVQFLDAASQTTCAALTPIPITKMYAGATDDTIDDFDNNRAGSLLDDIRIYGATFLATDIRELYFAGLSDHKSIAQK
jgi:prepilin-type N-terminal cleavage/methylation domain-containing protein